MGKDEHLHELTYMLYKWSVYDADFYYAYLHWYDWKKFNRYSAKYAFLKRTSNKSVKWRHFYD